MGFGLQEAGEFRPYLCETRQINQGEVKDVGRVDLEVDGLTVDALVATGYSRRLVLDLPLDVAEISEPPVGNVMKLGPLIPRSCSGIPVSRVECVLGLALRYVDQLQNQGSPGDDATAAGQEIAANDILEDRGLSR